jgi:hypothetical protein
MDSWKNNFKLFIAANMMKQNTATICDGHWKNSVCGTQKLDGQVSFSDNSANRLKPKFRYGLLKLLNYLNLVKWGTVTVS